jgi:quercetin dioxygenase-like cupin family protein
MLATPPEFIDLTPEMKARLDRFRDEHRGEPIGKVGDRIIMEDERVRIWELTLEPGEAGDFHRHDLDYYLIILGGDYVAGVCLEDSPIESFVGKVPEAGNTVSIPKGNVEWAYNVGDETYRDLIVEIKDS